MHDWNRLVSEIGEARIIATLGILELAAAFARVSFWQRKSQLDDLVATDLLIILPGIVLLYGAMRVRKSDLHPDVLPVIATRCLIGVGAMLGLVAVLAAATGLNRPVFTPLVAMGIGGVAGYGIGINEAKALSRAREAEQAKQEVERHSEELRRERDLRERIVQTSPVGIAIIDMDGSVRMANERASEIAGVSQSELEAFDVYDESRLQIRDTDGDPVAERLLDQITETGDPIYDVERQITPPDGHRTWISVNGSPLRDQSGELTGIVVAFEDVTEREEYQRKLEESNERLRQFAYAASHDLQEPLRMVSSYLQLLERRYEGALDEEGEEYLEFAVDSADRMRAMIDGLLQYSRVDRETDDFEPVDLDAVVDDVLADLSVSIDESDAEITVDELPTVEGDEDKLRQVFQNLLSNAIRYSGDDPPRVHVAAERNGSVWDVTVRDEGIGIDPEQSDAIFEVFESLHSQEDHDGVGIGLALCERIVELHGGDIWVDSAPGDGSTFHFTIPVVRNEHAEPTRPPRSSE